MSYCRWSTNDYLCDLYCYESDEGFLTHVATRKRVYRKPLPPRVEYDPNNTQPFFDRHMKINSMEEGQDFDYALIGLAYDGRTFVDSDKDSFRDRLVMLRDAGYQFPFYLILELGA